MTTQTPPQGSSPLSVGRFDPNEGATEDDKGFRLPNVDPRVHIGDIEGYVRYFETLFGGGGNPIEAAAKSLDADAKYSYERAKQPENARGDIQHRAEAIKARPELAKSLKAVPSAFAYGRMSYMPDSAVNGGVIQWPGINPNSLRKIARENIAPQLIIGMRIDDVIRYSQWSDQIWRPGWRIESLIPGEKLKPKEVQEAVRFLHNCNIETNYTQARDRDTKRLTNFQRFLSAMVRDSLTFDMIAVWTEMGNNEQVKAFALLPAGNIRFCTAEGYAGNPENFAVAVDDGGRVVQAFTRDQLTCYVRNIRTDPDVWGYGWPEIEIGMRVIKGFQNALDLNVDIFDRNAVANGILTISGGAVTQRQLDLLNRLITNMKKGITKAWALPVIGLQGDSKLELLDLTKIKGNEAYYKEFMNMLAGALCTLWRFPVRRLGYKISGGHKDNEPPADGSTALVDDDDPGLSPLLQHIETVINEYLLQSRWPHLRFRFTGKNPKEDAREYEALSLARTYGERRAEVGLPRLETLVKKPKAIGKDKKSDADDDDEESEDDAKGDDKEKKAVKKADYKVKVKFKNADGKDKKPGEEGEEDAEGSEDDLNGEGDPEEEVDEEEETQKSLITIANIMELCPMDPNLASVFQAALSVAFKSSDSGGGGGDGDGGGGGMFGKDPGKKGNLMTSKKDPAQSENKGHTAGVRRDSKAEAK